MIAIIDYSAGNTRSVMNAVRRVGAEFEVTDDPIKILNADRVIFPGVGHAAHAMNTLKEKGLDEVIRRVEKPLLGICIGMQLLFDFSEEGETQCLGIIEGSVKKFSEEDKIVPQIGWNNVRHDNSDLFADIEQDAWFYTVNSYYASDTPYASAHSEYGVKYTSAVKKDNFYGTQFHPEKSADNGNQLLKNFIEL